MKPLDYMTKMTYLKKQFKSKYSDMFLKFQPACSRLKTLRKFISKSLSPNYNLRKCYFMQL